MLDMFDQMLEAAKSGRSMFIEMKDVETITPESIAVLNHFLKRISNDYGVKIGGSEPDSGQMTEILRRSGFYYHVRPPQNAKSIAPDAGIVAHEEKQFVDPQLAQRLVHFATTRLFGRSKDNHAIYAALGEMMGNTFDHAHRRSAGYEHWWASVYYDETTSTAHFTFFDTGVGIFGSREVSSLPDIARSMFGTDTAFLRDMFEGNIASRTGLPWRGLGLPRIYQRVKRGDLTNVTVITNKVIGHLDSGQFRSLSHAFPGTLYHWELRHNAGSND